MRLQGDYESFVVSSEELWQVCWIRGIDGSDLLDTSRGIGGKDSTGDRERQGGGGERADISYLGIAVAIFAKSRSEVFNISDRGYLGSTYGN